VKNRKPFFSDLFGTYGSGAYISSTTIPNLRLLALARSYPIFSIFLKRHLRLQSADSFKFVAIVYKFRS